MAFKQHNSSNDMENHPHESIDTIFSCVIPYIQNGDDRNSVSSVCRNWYELDCMTRKHVTIHMFYSPTPSHLHQRFPSIESLTLKGLPDWFPEKKLSIDINRWIQDIAVSFTRLKSLHIRHMDVNDSDLELLARTRGRDLRVLKINKCKGFSTDGLLHIGKYCNDLRTLCLKGNQFNNKDGKWLHELALQNTSIESLDFSYVYIHDVNDLTLLAKNCCRSLISLKVDEQVVDLIIQVDVFRHAVRLEVFVGGEWDEDQVFAGFKFPTSMRCMGMCSLTKSSFPFVLPFAHQLRELHLTDLLLDDISLCVLIRICPNLEVLYADTVFKDRGLQVIGQFCKKLRKFKTDDRVTAEGLITMAQGCHELESLQIKLTDISNEMLKCIGTHLKNLRDFNMSCYYCIKTSLPLDNGIRAMLIGCSKLERLSLDLPTQHGILTDVGLGYIGKYGHNLRYLYLCGGGESDAGLVELSKGCSKLRKLDMMVCPFSEQAIATFLFNMHSLMYVRIRFMCGHATLAMTRPNS